MRDGTRPAVARITRPAALRRTTAGLVEGGVMMTRWGTNRIEAFSDGVFAIAITLLVLDLNVPETSDDLLQGILDAWPSYLAYGTSFLTIGGIWLAHHALFARLRQVSASLLRANLLLLMAVAFVPYPTRLVAESIHNESAERTAVVFYGLTLLVVAIIAAVMWRFVAFSPDLLRRSSRSTRYARSRGAPSRISRSTPASRRSAWWPRGPRPSATSWSPSCR